MRQTRHARLVLMRAAGLFAPRFGVHFVEGDPPVGGGGKEKKVEPTEPKKLELTEDEIQARIDAALEKDRKIAADKKKKDDDQAALDKAAKDGDLQALADAASAKATASEEKAAAAERRAQLAEVNVQVRDHLASKHADYLANAPDIMMHVTAKLAADAKPADVAKLIADEAKAFVDRTPRSKVTPPPAPPVNRNSVGATSNVTDNGQPRPITGAAARF